MANLPELPRDKNTLELNNPDHMFYGAILLNHLTIQESEKIVSDKKVIAVVVTFNPDRRNFAQLLVALLPQVAGAIVVDNASSIDIRPLLDVTTNRAVELVQMSKNLGIAAAQNAGIERALDLGAAFVLLLDQDSLPSPCMVTELVSVLTSASGTAENQPVAAVGPAQIDRRTGEQTFFMVKRAGLIRQWKPNTHRAELPTFVETEFLLASGTLIPIQVFKAIGSMRSNYFIDHVDREWCFRAKSAGYRLLGAPASILEHQVGDMIKNVSFFPRIKVKWHNPLRHYYLFRNAILMHRDVAIPIAWKIYFVMRLMRYAVGILVMAADRWSRLAYLALGIVHGCKGVRGFFDTSANQCIVIPVSPLEPKS